MPYCPNCGTQNSDNAKFCVNCGAAMPSVPNEQRPIPQSSPVYSQAGVGSKVSFTAADGKTYTGTIQEIKGNQYKIKYDAFDFETWLTKDQFTLAGDNPAVPPVYTTASTKTQPHVTATHTSRPSVARSSFITHLGLWGSLMIIVGFFTDWINSGFFFGQYSQSISGLQIMTYAGDLLNASNQNEFVIGLIIAIALIVLSAIICFLYIIGLPIGRGAFSLFKILPLLVIIGIIVYIIIKAQEAGIKADDIPKDNSDIWKIFGVGIYLTLIGSVVLAVSRNRR